jgi:glycosyltransferase involved in cell wall biosynthesis
LGKKVLMLLTNGFRPDPRVAKEAEALSEAGYEVTVLAWDREQTFPPIAEYGEVHIERIRTGWAGSMVSLAMRYPLFFAQCVRRALKYDVAVVHSHDLDTLIPGYFISWLKGVPLVFDAHEHYANMVATDLPPWVSPLVDRVEAVLVRRATMVVTVSEGHASYLRPNARSEVVIVENCIEPPKGLRRSVHEGDDVVLFYAGTLEPMRYIQEAIVALRPRNDCVVKVAGFGRLEGFVKNEEPSGKVRFLGFLPHDVMMNEMASSDVILCLLDPSNKNYKAGSQTKLYEAMAIGVPVITSKDTYSGDIVEAEGCGLVIEWSEQNFRQAVERLKDPKLRAEMGAAGQKAAVRQYNWPEMKRRLVEGYKRITA